MPATAKNLTYQAFVSSFNKDKISRFYYIYGTEEYLKRKVYNTIVDEVIPKEQRDFDLVIFYGDDCSIVDFLDAVSTRPFLSEEKVVILRKFDSLKTGNQQKIIDFLTQNEIFSIVILIADSFDNRLKIAKQISQLGPIINCRSPYRPEEMLPWINGEINNQNKTIDKDAALLFVNRVEMDYMTAASELEKLLLFSINTKRITVSDVQISTGYSKTYSVFDLLNAVGERDMRKTFIIVENLMDNKETAVFVISMLLRFFVQLWRINALKAKKISDEEIVAKHLADIYTSYRRNHLQYAKRYPLSIIPSIFSILLETDTELKSINLEEALLVERMLFRIFALR
ncbi:MAG: DNA polymerase III subunit delta [Candidatus Cloacimonetes bacterium]|nr:DNA polymerase III subunit delta [Candidatus Cloacimonadota bacterium]